MKFKIINSDQGHNYTHYVDAPDRQTAMERFKAGHYGFIIDCEEVKSVAEDKKAPVLEELPEPIGNFIFANANGKMMPDGAYYHYSDVIY